MEVEQIGKAKVQEAGEKFRSILSVDVESSLLEHNKWREIARIWATHRRQSIIKNRLFTAGTEFYQEDKATRDENSKGDK